MVNSVAIIPARGGSKRIPRKNIREFAGKPIIAWPIGTALASGLFDKVIVSTDDVKIAEVARRVGALIPFIRPEQLSDDFADTKDVVRHAISALKLENDADVQVCCIYPTSVFVTPKYLEDGLNLLSHERCSFVLSITRVDPTVLRSFTQDTYGKLKMVFPENFNRRTQDLPELYCDAAQFYWGSVSTWQSDEPIFSENSRGVFFDSGRVQDIDTEQQWLSAEAKFLKLN
jgi:N-acylneuraminate cytidylyltransferase